jgi:hypothetical protein
MARMEGHAGLQPLCLQCSRLAARCEHLNSLKIGMDSASSSIRPRNLWHADQAVELPDDL